MGFFEGDGAAQQRQGLLSMGRTGQQSYGALGNQLNDEAAYLKRLASGEDSLSAEQLRQSLAKTNAQQQSMAASASPQNQAMAAMNASRNAMQASGNLAGQQAVAGIQERQAAQNSLLQMLLQRRAQEQAAAQFGYGNVKPGQSWLDRFGGAVAGGAQLATMV